MKNFDLQKITEEQLQRQQLAAEQSNETEASPESWTADFAASGGGKGDGGGDAAISP